jgi:hypothetical protein
MMNSEHFERIEEALSEVLSIVKDNLNYLDIAAVQEFIDVGEYGLAYERLWDTLPSTLNQEVREKLRQAGASMGYSDV